MGIEESKERCYQKITDFIFTYPETFDELLTDIVSPNMDSNDLQCLLNDSGLIHDVHMTRDSSGKLIRRDKVYPKESLYYFLKNSLSINMTSTDLTPPSQYFNN